MLFAARGGGALIGPILLRPLVGDDAGRIRTAIVFSFVLSSLGYFIFGLSAAIGLWLAAVALIVGHLGGGANWVTSTILLQEFVPNRLLGRILAIDTGLVTLTTAVSTLGYSLALQGFVSPVFLAFLGAAIFIVYGLVWNSLTIRPKLRINNQTISDMKDETATTF